VPEAYDGWLGDASAGLSRSPAPLQMTWSNQSKSPILFSILRLVIFVLIAFFCEFPFHRAMLEETYRLCGGQQSHEIRWVEEADELVHIKPDIIVYANRVPNSVRKQLPARTLYVFTRHGFSTKNYLPKRLLDCDVICLSSGAVKRHLEKVYVRPCMEYWITGFPATDDLWRTAQEPRPDGSTTLLYAPTWTPALSAHPVIGVNWMDDWLSRPGRKLLIKPHPHIPKQQPGWMRDFQRAAARHIGELEIVDPDASIYPLMPHADVLLSDTSSVMFYFLALDKPIVLVDPLAPDADQGVDRLGPEWLWRDMGRRVSSPDQLLPALEAALSDPSEHAGVRNTYREHVYGDLFDGHASRRLAEHLLEAAQRPETWPTDPRRHRSRTRRYINRFKQFLARVWP